MSIEKPIRRTMNVGELLPAPHNPPNRCSRKALRRLQDSIELVGMLHPITISLDNEVIDGHRRLAVAKILGWKTIECNVVQKGAAEIYASINVSSRPMNGNDALNVWLVTPAAAPARLISGFEEMTEIIGRPTVRRLADAGLSMRVFLTARRIARYCEADDKITIKKIVCWLIEFPVVGKVMKAIEAGVSPKKILEAVKANKPVKLSLEVA